MNANTATESFEAERIAGAPLPGMDGWAPAELKAFAYFAWVDRLPVEDTVLRDSEYPKYHCDASTTMR